MEEILLEKNKLINAPVGVSMLPLLRPNRDVVILENNLKPEIYDVVLYKRDNGKYILHRIIDVDSNGYVMCGDCLLYTSLKFLINIILSLFAIYQGQCMK